ncbi:unnamed protein product [Gadus morhua 'NCC']
MSESYSSTALAHTCKAGFLIHKDIQAQHLNPPSSPPFHSPLSKLGPARQCSTLSTHLPVASVLLGPSKPVHKPQQRPSGERESKASDMQLANAA